ncbi:drug resistance transporter, EmrB/QacA subfamily [Amycolatopsis marina]|uniref:Drug resistance transporter, EmrB/QacA subfamily n=1 Tax=Amycolatopsis marina TaxID=490629 RepID=A0A1I1CVK7_9PSEU|nr:MFS transporter [Amycolatopsis marina]SFB64453.1 drug resistance transporter, EmrB/QacA subfamily [Amycolatopsis marina]
MNVERARDPGSARLVLTLACTAQFMVVLDVSVVNVALPSIQQSLGFDTADLSWVVNAYALVFAGFLLLGGRLADLFGQRRTVLIGLALFSASSLIAGLAETPAVLVTARAVQGLGAAVLAPASLTMLTTTFPEGAPRVRALAAWTAVGLAGGTAGNLIGGVLTTYLSWRWVLLINVPFGALAILPAIRFLATGTGHRTRRLDLPGAMLVTAGLLTLAYGIVRTREHGWSEPGTIGALSLGAGLLMTFVVVETRLAPVPLLPLRLLRLRTVTVGNIVLVLTGACLVPMWYFLSLTMQHVLHLDALHTGLGFLPHTVLTILVGTQVVPRLMRRADGRTLIITGTLIAAGGFLWQSSITAADDYFSGILGPAILVSAGTGLLNTPVTATATSGVPEHDAGAASGLTNTAKQVGGALGLAVLATVTGGTGNTPENLVADYRSAFGIISAVLVLSAAFALFLPRAPDSGTPRPQGQQDRRAV